VLCDWFDAYKGEQLTQVIERLDQQSHETMMSPKQGERQSDRIGGNGNDRLCDVDCSKSGMSQPICSAEQGPFEHEASLAPYFWNNLVGNSLFAPHEDVPFFNHSSEEVLIFPRPKFWPEWLRARFDECRL
jgi:hypothetical protein